MLRFGRPERPLKVPISGMPSSSNNSNQTDTTTVQGWCSNRQQRLIHSCTHELHIGPIGPLFTWASHVHGLRGLNDTERCHHQFMHYDRRES